RICKSVDRIGAGGKLPAQQHRHLHLHLHRRFSTGGAALAAVVVRNPSAHVGGGRRSAHDLSQGDRTAGEKHLRSIVRTEDEAGGDDD
ncbi:unnamed protein product, partial [Ectocarpus fasciculatus]